MIRDVRNGGIAVLILTLCAVGTLTDALRLSMGKRSVISSEYAAWVLLGGVVWILLGILISLLPERYEAQQKPIEIRVVVFPFWAWAWQALGIGTVVAWATGNVSWGIGLAWISVPWIVWLAWRDMKRYKRHKDGSQDF